MLSHSSLLNFLMHNFKILFLSHDYAWNTSIISFYVALQICIRSCSLLSAIFELPWHKNLCNIHITKLLHIEKRKCCICFVSTWQDKAYHSFMVIVEINYFCHQLVLLQITERQVLCFPVFVFFFVASTRACKLH